MQRLLASLLAVIALGACAAVAGAGGFCDRAVSYFVYPYDAGERQYYEWHVYDPSRGGNVLFLTSPGGFEELRWDTSFSTAYYRSGLTLYRVAWKYGAKSEAVCDLPQLKNPVNWWFNPDSACWQYASANLIETGEVHLRYACELWQSSRDCWSWKRIRADTLVCEKGDCDEWSWTEGEWAKPAPSVTLKDLDGVTWPATWADRALPFDTLTVTTGDAGSGGADGWYYVGTSHASRRGIAFRMRHASEPEASEPYYFVDLDRKTLRRIESLRPDDAWSSSLMAECCDLLLLPGPTGNPLIVNPTSGRVVFSRAWNAKRAVWVTRPRW